MTWTDSEQVLHARQVINAYDHQRALGNAQQALEHLKRAMDALMQAIFGIEDEIRVKVRNRE